MSRRIFTSAERSLRQNAGTQAARHLFDSEEQILNQASGHSRGHTYTQASGRRQYRQVVSPHWSDSEDEVLNQASDQSRGHKYTQASGRRQYRQVVSPHWSDSEEEVLNQASNSRCGYRYNEYGEPQSPPPPYSEQDHGLDGGQTLSSSRVNLYPGEGGRPDYVTDSSGRRERYIINERGERVPWPFPDHENSSDDGDGDPNMMHMESGRVIPRSEWEADHSMEYSSDEPSDDRDREVYQNHHSPMNRTRDRTPSRWTSGSDDCDREIPRVRRGHSAGSRHSGRQSLAGCGRPSRHRT